ncbi:Box C/D snoRNA protein 1 [Phlyctochytrium bullatum]|nr:Box C/D snoRNA protein 1 [Phlyctochytrium bullatum]
MNDFSLLEEVGRISDNAFRDPIKHMTRPPPRHLSVKQQLLFKSCRNRSMKIKFLPLGMTKSTTNRSIFLKRIDEDTKVLDALQRTLGTEQAIQPDTRAIVKSYLASDYRVYLRDEKSTLKHPFYFEIDKNKTLGEGLKGRELVEYPTLLVKTEPFPEENIRRPTVKPQGATAVKLEDHEGGAIEDEEMEEEFVMAKQEEEEDEEGAITDEEMDEEFVITKEEMEEDGGASKEDGE